MKSCKSRESTSVASSGRHSTQEVPAKRELDKSVPHADLHFSCAYTAAVSKAPRRRGVMLPTKCKEDDFRTLRNWGATLVRFQICRNWHLENDNQDLDEFDQWLDGMLDHLDHEILPWAGKYGMDVVVDLHVAPGGRVKSEMKMFYEKRFGDHFILCWQRIARRFKGRDNIYGYDLINEPNQQSQGIDDGDYWDLQRRAAEAIRVIDPDVSIIVESNDWASPATFSYMRPIRLPNVIYQAHMYLPLAYTHQGVHNPSGWIPAKYPDPQNGWDKDFLRQKLSDVRNFQLEHNAKIYIGEFSAIAWAAGADIYIRDLISIFEEYGWDWSFHAFREWSGWSVEHECAGPGLPFMPSSANPRMKALTDGFRNASS